MSDGNNNREEDTKWMWRPYPKTYISSTQIWSMIATLPTVINVITLCTGVLAMIWIQTLCCRRYPASKLKWLIFLCMINALGMICAGLFVSNQWGPYFLDETNVNYIMLVSVICGFVWVFIAFKIVWFLESGDHKRYEERLEEEEEERRQLEERRRQRQGDIESSSEEASGSSNAEDER